MLIWCISRHSNHIATRLCRHRTLYNENTKKYQKIADISLEIIIFHFLVIFPNLPSTLGGWVNSEKIPKKLKIT